jgi:hypothetical protein
VLTVSAAAGVLANDHDPDGDPLRICPQSRVVGHDLLLAPTNGTVTMNEDGSFSYTPYAGFVGVDTFYYCTEDGPACVEGRVDITVTAVVGTGQQPTFSLNGSAVNTAAGLFTVTPDTALQHGSVMSGTRVDLSKTFDITFGINVGNNPNGADGMGFVLHNDPLGSHALGGVGGGKGMMGIQNGIGIAFDTYYNAADLNDMVNNHTNFINTMGGDNAGLSPNTDLGSIENGLWHAVHVVSNGQTLSYTVDGVAMSSLSVATAETYLGSQYAYFGFTGGTGGLSEQDQVKITALNATAENGASLQVGGTGGNIGNNQIVSGANSNILTGGPGNDTFVFAPGFGNDTITDFTRVVGDRDMIDLTAFHFASGADALSHAVANGVDTVFNFGNNDTLTVLHTAAGNVTNLLVNDLLI